VPHSTFARITYAVFASICLAALWKGDREERMAGVVLLLTTIFTPLIQDRIHWMDPGARFLIEDSLLLVLLLGLAMRHGRTWMLFAAAFQLLSTLSHPAAHLSPRVGPIAYIVIFQLFSYGVYLSLGAGVLVDHLIARREQAR